MLAIRKSVEQENAPTRREVAPADQLNDRNDAVFLKGQVAGKKMGGNVFLIRFSETANQLKEPLWMCGMLVPLQVQTHILKAGDRLTRLLQFLLQFSEKCLRFFCEFL